MTLNLLTLTIRSHFSMDMSAYKNDTPAQARERLQWQLDVIRENQRPVSGILFYMCDGLLEQAKHELRCMHKNDRDAILQPGGILTDDQIELLK